MSVINDIILKITGNEIENILENIHDLRENILYMLSFEKTVREEQQKVIKPSLIDGDKPDNEDEDKYKFTLPIFK